MSAPVAAATKQAPAKQEAGRSAARAAPVPEPVIAPPVLIQRKCACGGGCPTCEDEKKKPVLQTKLQVNTPGDVFEQEADRVADQVVAISATPLAMPAATAPFSPAFSPAMPSRGRAPPSAIQRKCACGGTCSGCEEKEKLAQRKAAPNTGHTPAAAVDVNPQSLGSGSPLDRSTRSFMESRFNADFSHVRVHDGPRAAIAAQSVNALAYTVGHDIVFGHGQYSPGTTQGTRLLAHELTHVLQQSTGLRLLQRQAAPAACSGKPSGLGFVAPSPECVKSPSRDIGFEGHHFHFCPDSDQLAAETPATIAAFVKRQEPDAQYIIHGYASPEGGVSYNLNLSCHRANRMSELLQEAGVDPAEITEVAAKGPTDEFPGGPEFNRVAVVLAEVPPERRFGQFRPDPECPKTPTNLGNVEPSPACPEDLRDLGTECRDLDDKTRNNECDSYHFCLDSDVFADSDTPGTVMNFARQRPATTHYTVHGYASDEGTRARPYNMRLSCHRAKRVARELMKAGVPQQQIDIAAKGATTQFGDAEANRVAVVRAAFPNINAEPAMKRPKTIPEKRAILDLAIARLNTGGYRLEADAYISFWTCGRVPTLRHAVNTTHWFVEKEPGVPVYRHFPFTTEESVGEAGGRLGLNSAVVSDDVLTPRLAEGPPKLADVMEAMTFLSFFDKVSDEDFGSDRKTDSERDLGAKHFAQLEGKKVPGPDPLADKPAPKCTKIPPPTFQGAAKPGEAGVAVPKFEVKEAAFRGGSGKTVFLAPLPGNKGSMETDGNALSANAKVTVTGNPQEIRNYDVGYLLTIAEDRTNIAYTAGENVQVGLPVPLRDTDGFQPVEPWYSDGSFDSPKQGRVEVSMSKVMAQEVALTFRDLSGQRTGTAGSPLKSVQRNTQYQLWLVARRRGAPLDAFSTHFLSGTRVDFQQDLDASGKTPTGRFKTSLPLGGDPSVVRFNGPIPQELGAKETTTSDVISSCTQGFGKVRFEVDNKEAKGVSNVVFPKRRPMNFKTKPPGLSLLPNPTPLQYKPRITLLRTADAEKFEVGLIQNVLEVDWKNHYSSGVVVSERCKRPLPMRDASEDPQLTDRVFMSNQEPERFQLERDRREVNLALRDVPGGDAMLDLADNPDCPGQTGTLTRIEVNHKFRTWAAVRFNKDSSCLLFKHRIDWILKYVATANPDKVITADLTPVDSEEDPSQRPVLTGLANRDCGSDYSCP